MSAPVSEAVKDPKKQKAGRASALRRWGPDGRIVRLDSLDTVTKEIVVAILRARRNAAEGDGSTT